MAKVEWSAGIDSVSGALAKPGKNPQHRCTKMLLGTHRKAETTNPDCNRLYLRKQTERSTPVTADELAIRERFGAVGAAVAARAKDLTKMAADKAAVGAAVAARAKDLTKMAADKAAFIAQKDLPGGRRTMKSYLWKVCGEEYDQH